MRTRTALSLFLLAAGVARADWQSLGDITAVEHDATTVTIHCDKAALQISAIADGVARIRLAPSGTFARDFSWAVKDPSPKGTIEQFDEDSHSCKFSAGGLQFVVSRRPCRLSIFDHTGRPLVVDDASRGIAFSQAATTQPTIDQPAPVRVWQQLPQGTAIYGLGEKTGPLNKRGLALTMWNTDTSYGPSTDPIYQSIPFFLAANDGNCCGIFLDNPWRSSFDFDKESRNTLSFGAEGGELNYYVLAGPTPKDVLQRYTDLTGRLELPPLWSLGYQQCRYSYYPESRVREIAATFRKKKIPCDVLYLDIDYMDGFRCFTWNRKWFPDPHKLTNDLHADGFHVVTIIDPGIKVDPNYPVYDSGTKQNAWLTQPDGKPYIGRVWPGDSVFPDFTNPAIRDWWADLFPPFIESSGVDGIWNDMNEPANFSLPTHTVPLDLRCNNEGELASHRAAHNIYGMQMHRATRDGLLRARRGQRAFTLTRATYAGGQRFGAAWTGDNASTWEHLGLSISMTLGMGLSGLPFVGPDIGGFNGGASPELYARWIQVGALLPYCRTHTSWTSPDQEPWSFGPKVEEIARQSIRRRYEMLPYIYTLMEESTRTGTPIVRPVWMEFPDWRSHWDEGSIFMLGNELLVMPTLQPAARDRTVWLPPGVWYDVASGNVHAAGQPVPVPGALDHLPLFARAGAIIPMQSPIQHTGERPRDPFIIDIWPNADSSGAVYEDDGATYRFRKGEFHRTQIRCRTDGDNIDVTLSRPEGTFVPPQRTPLIRFHGLGGDVELARCAYGEEFPAADLAMNTVEKFHSHDGKTWFVRMKPDDGRPQALRILVKPQPGETKPVRFQLSEKNPLLHVSDMLPPRYEDGGVRLEIKNTWNTYLVLPRIRASAEALPILKLRISTEKTKQLSVRFATEQNPTLSDRVAARFAVTPDGKPHDYTIDLAKESPDTWKGTVYFLRIDFTAGTTADETVRLERVALEPRP